MTDEVAELERVSDELVGGRWDADEQVGQIAGSQVEQEEIGHTAHARVRNDDVGDEEVSGCADDDDDDEDDRSDDLPEEIVETDEGQLFVGQ